MARGERTVLAPTDGAGDSTCGRLEVGVPDRERRLAHPASERGREPALAYSQARATGLLSFSEQCPDYKGQKCGVGFLSHLPPLKSGL